MVQYPRNITSISMRARIYGRKYSPSIQAYSVHLSCLRARSWYRLRAVSYLLYGVSENRPRPFAEVRCHVGAVDYEHDSSNTKEPEVGHADRKSLLGPLFRLDSERDQWTIGGATGRAGDRPNEDAQRILAAILLLLPVNREERFIKGGIRHDQEVARCMAIVTVCNNI